MSIVYTGLRAGEKLHEDLFSDDEDDVRPVHPLISHVDVPPLPREAIDAFAPADRPREVRQWLVERCSIGAAATTTLVERSGGDGSQVSR